MPSNSAIVLADSQATPVNHTFTPVKIKGDLASYCNYAGTYPIGRETLSVSMAENAKVRKVVITMKVPRVVVETINGVAQPSVPDYGMIKQEVFIPVTWNQAQAEDIIEMSANALKHSTLVGMGATGEFVY